MSTSPVTDEILQDTLDLFILIDGIIDDLEATTKGHRTTLTNIAVTIRETLLEMAKKDRSNHLQSASKSKD